MADEVLTYDQIKKFKVAELRSRLGQLGLHTSGLKAELIGRLTEYYDSLESPTSNSSPASDSDQDVIRPLVSEIVSAVDAEQKLAPVKVELLDVEVQQDVSGSGVVQETEDMQDEGVRNVLTELVMKVEPDKPVEHVEQDKPDQEKQDTSMEVDQVEPVESVTTPQEAMPVDVPQVVNVGDQVDSGKNDHTENVTIKQETAVTPSPTQHKPTLTSPYSSSPSNIVHPDVPKPPVIATPPVHVKDDGPPGVPGIDQSDVLDHDVPVPQRITEPPRPLLSDGGPPGVALTHPPPQPEVDVGPPGVPGMVTAVEMSRPATNIQSPRSVQSPMVKSPVPAMKSPLSTVSSPIPKSPALKSPVPVTKSPVPTQHQKSPPPNVQSPVATLQSPLKQSPLPTVPSPLVKLPVPVEQSPETAKQSPMWTEPSPVTTSPVPAKQSPVSIAQSPVPTMQSPMTTEKSPVPTGKSPMPALQSPVQTAQSPMPTPQSPMSSEKSPVPTAKSPTPTLQSPVPAKQSPMQTAQSPMQSPDLRSPPVQLPHTPTVQPEPVVPVKTAQSPVATTKTPEVIVPQQTAGPLQNKSRAPQPSLIPEREIQRAKEIALRSIENRLQAADKGSDSGYDVDQGEQESIQQPQVEVGKKKKKKKKRRKRAGQQTTAPADTHADEGIEVEYVAEELDAKDPVYAQFAQVFETFKLSEKPDATKKDEKDKTDAQAADAAKKVLNDDEMDTDSDEEETKKADETGDKVEKISKKKLKLKNRMSVAELKQHVNRPDVVEMHDVTAPDPKLLVFLKACRNTVPVPRHWCFKRKFLQGKRGIIKPPFQLPEFIQKTGIMEMREALQEKEDAKNMKAKMREKIRPKMGKIDIDYQKLHDAFFKWQTKPKMSIHGDLYYEGKEFETKLKQKKPGDLSEELRTALGMPTGQGSQLVPPPWLIAMQRYGPPPSYPNLKIRGLNAPIPEGAAFGYHAGGWGKPPVDEQGRPLYGDVFGVQQLDGGFLDDDQVDSTLWGELESESEESEESEEESEEELPDQTGLITPAETGLVTPSGLTSIPAGMETPDMIELRKRKNIEEAMESGAEQPTLYTVLPEKRSTVGSMMMGSAHVYDMASAVPTGARKAPGGLSEGVEVALDPSELELDPAAMQARYDEQLREQQNIQKEDFSDMVAEHAARQQKKRKKTTDSGKGAKKYKEFKF